MSHAEHACNFMDEHTGEIPLITTLIPCIQAHPTLRNRNNRSVIITMKRNVSHESSETLMSVAKVNFDSPPAE